MVLLNLALASRKSDGTNAFVPIDLIDAVPTVFAGIAFTVVDISMAISTCITSLTGTMVIIDEINARGTVLTLPDTVIDILVAILPRPTVLALTTIISNEIHA